MKKIKPLLFIVLLFGPGIFSLRAQKGPVAAGGEATGSGGTVSYSVGQIDYTSVSGATGNVNEGLQQPYEIFSMGSEEEEITLELSLYPNPSTGQVYLSIGNLPPGNLNWSLFDMNGKALQNSIITEKITLIPMELLSSATYMLRISNSEKEIKTFKIIKK